MNSSADGPQPPSRTGAPASAGSTPDAQVDADLDATEACSPTTTPERLEDLAAHRPDLRAAIALNPAATATLLARLAFEGDADVHAALRARAHGNLPGHPAGPPEPPEPLDPSEAPPPSRPTTVDVQWAEPPRPVGGGLDWTTPARPAGESPSFRVVRTDTPTAAAPASAHRRIRAAAAVLATLVIAAVGAGAGMPVRTATRDGWPDQFATPSRQWADGAHEAWSVPTHSSEWHSLILSPSRERVAVMSQLGTGDTTTLETWDISGAQPRALWSADVGSPGAIGDSPTFTTRTWWGEDLLLDDLVVDPVSGATTDAPWRAADRVSVINGVVAVSCDDRDQCTAWDLDHERLWSARLPGSYLETRALQEDGRWWAPLYSENWTGVQMVEVSTGETREVDLGAFASVSLQPARDGWIALLDDDNGAGTGTDESDMRLLALSPSGRVVDAADTTSTGLTRGFTVSPGGTETVHDYMATLGGHAPGPQAIRVAAQPPQCQRLMLGSRALETPRSLAPWVDVNAAVPGTAWSSGSSGGEDDGEGDAACLSGWSRVSASVGGSVVVGVLTPITSSPTAVALDTRAGRFSWTQPGLATAQLARPDLLVAIDTDGALIGFAPGSEDSD